MQLDFNCSKNNKMFSFCGQLVSVLAKAFIGRYLCRGMFS